MRTIGFLLGIPESDQEAIRDRLNDNLRLADADATEFKAYNNDPATEFGDYIDWRANNPSDDLMTELINAEFEDEKGITRTPHP